MDAFAAAVATQTQIRGLDLELIDGALEFGRPLGGAGCSCAQANAAASNHTPSLAIADRIPSVYNSELLRRLI